MRKERKNRFCFKKARWILAAATALSLYPGNVFAEENMEVENTAAEPSVKESTMPVPETTEMPVLTETPVPTEAVTPTKVPEPVKTQKSAEKQEKSTPVKEKAVFNASVETTSSAQIISVDITWGNMGFVYKKGLWNPKTHQYGTGSWNPDRDGSSQISISNNGTESVKAFLTYTQVDTSYSGSFQNGNGENISAITLSVGENTSAYLVLAGTPSEEFSNNVLGTVTVTIGGQ